MQVSLDNVLRVDRLNLPSRPRVEDIQWYPFTNSLGEPAYRITVILADDTQPEFRQRSLTRQIEDEIFRALRDAGVEEFPYVRVATREDLAWAEANR